MKKNGEDSYQHVLKYTGLFGGVQGLIILIGLVRNKAMAVLLGAGGMGFNALMISVQTLLRSLLIWDCRSELCPSCLRCTSRKTTHN